MKKKLFILFLTVATAVCLAIGITACGESSSDNQSTESSGKQVPVYQGMVISSAADGVSALSSDGDIAMFASADFKGDDNVSGDILGSEDVDIDNPFGKEAPTIEEEIEASFGVTGTGEAVYYADADEDILITVKFSNPDSFEILSFKINGKTYASYMFEYGSDMENIIVKLNVGSVAGFNEYTIDEIKYVDGTEIKDVLLNGETSVRCGVRTDEIPSVVVSGETAGLDSISFSVRLYDVYDLIEESNGYAVAVLYDGTGIVETADIAKGNNTITFSSLSPNTVYQYAVIAVYDDLSGDGTCVNYFYTNALRTEAMVLFDNVSVTKTGVSFEFSWAEGYDDSWLHTKFTLETNGVITGSVDPTAREIDGLLSDTEYTLNVAYTGVRGETESIRLTFTTLAMETPEISISSLTATKTEINYAVVVTDADGVVKDVTVSLAKDGKEVESKEALSGTFDCLFSGTQYGVTVTYTYNLNDGQGDKTSEETRSITTTAMSAPKIYSYGLNVTKTAISYSLTVIDGDGTGSLTSVSLFQGDLPIGSSASSSGSFTGLLSGCTYTLTATYTYDLNDGYGERQLIETSYVTTEAVATPKLEIYTLTSTTGEITYEFVETDKDDVGDITSITLYRGAKEIYTATEWAGTFSGLLSDNEYTLVATYEYNLNDGEGVRSVEVTGSIYTKAKAAPTVSVYLLTSTKDSISYDIIITDRDSVVLSTSVVLSKGSDSKTEYSVYGTFTGLLSDNEYTLTIEVTYDLGDGEGVRTTEITNTIYTKPVVVPVIEAELTAFKEGIDYSLSVSDEDEVVTDVSVALYRGSEMREETSLLSGTFTGLLSDNDYTVKVVYSYDPCDGSDIHTIEKIYDVRTVAKDTPYVEIDELASTKDGVTYGYLVTDADGVILEVSVTLSGAQGTFTDTDLSGEFDALWSDNEYTLTVSYSYDLNNGKGIHSEKVTRTVSTLPMALPVVEIDLTYSKEEIDYTLSVSDDDGVMTDISVTLYKDSEVIEETSILDGTFMGLLSDNDYIVKVVYSYDSRDGNGMHTIEKIYNVRTIAKDTPYIVIEDLTSTKEGVTYGYSLTDADSVILEISVTLSGAQGTFTDTDLSGEFDALWSDSVYTLTVSYSYDLNDGVGTRTSEVSATISTLAKESPVAEIVFIDSTTSELTFAILFADEDSVGSIINVGLYNGTTLVNETGGAYTGEITFDGLSSYTLYKVIVAYEYDLGDGTGIKTDTVELSYYTDPDFSLISVSVINTSVITVGDTITIQAKMNNPNGVKFTSAVINGRSYNASSISNSTSLYVDVVVDDLIDGGNTDFIISSVTATIGGSTYTIYVEEGNTASAFVYGDIIINDFSLARFTNGRAEETRYRFLDEQIYFAVSLRNGTGYEVYSVTIDKTTYSGDSVTMSEDMQTVYVAANSLSSVGWKTANITGITYGTDSYGERSQSADITIEYMTLEDSNNVYEICTAEDLMNTDFTGYNYYKLMSDIDLSGYEILNLGDMVGVFDGNGYTISNVRAVKNVADETLYLGLFKEVTGIIMNLDLCDMLYMVTLTSSSSKTYTVYAGALAARADHMIAENCYVTSSFQITNESGGSVYIGALCGYGSTSSSSNRFFYNVIAEMSASVSCGSCNFAGFVGISVNFYEFDSTCNANVTIPDDDIDYIVTGGYKFSHENGEYLLAAYYGSEMNITLPETIEGSSYGIGYQAFYQSSVESVVIPDTVTSIGESAFYGCKQLTSVSIGSGVVSIGYQAFYNCTALTEIYYNAASVSDLSLYNFVFYDAGQNGSGIEVTIGSSVTKIPAYLFYPYTGSSYTPEIVNVIFEENSQCESIGKYAFAYCSKIASVNIPSSVILIDSNAFEGCSSLKSLTIGSGVTTMGTRAFYSCSHLTEIYFNAVAMENLSSSSYVFYNAGQSDSGITFTIGRDVTRIPAYIFYPYNSSTTSNITKVIFEENSQCTYIGSNAFNSCTSLTGVYITDIATWCMIDFGNATSNPLYYAGNLYLNNQLVTDLTIPDSVESIDDYAFYGCTSLTSVTIASGATLVGSYAFYDCVSLTSIFIPDSVTLIGSYAFYDCASLTSIFIPDGVASIGSYAFYKCTSLTAIIIPDSVTSIGDHAFYGCTSLTTLSIGKGVVTIGTYAFYNCTALTVIYFNAVAMDGLSSNNHVFSYAGQSGSGITFIIGSSVTEIPTDLFYPYSSSSSYNPQITIIIFEENSQCTRIGSNAFNNCSSIKCVYYSGTASDWNNISIGSSNSYMTSATRYYYSETEPTEDGNYWHYVDGEVVIWTKED